MKLQEAVSLIRPAFSGPQTSKAWADLGAGDGLFTRSLATVLGKGSIIHAVDKSLQEIAVSFNGNRIIFHQFDFVSDILPFDELDGILMANSLHFVKDKRRLLSRLKNHLRQEGQILVIEYELGIENQWVPYPIPFAVLAELLTEIGYKNTRRIGAHQSIYRNRTMYACVAINGGS